MRFAPAVQAAIARLDPDLPVFDARPLSEELAVLLAPQRAAAALFSVSGFLALVLAALGAYSVVAYSVGRRTQEIGLRMAMGATPARVLNLVVRESTVSVFVGLALGLGAAFALGRYVESLIVLVSTRDPVVFTVTGVVLATVGLAASYLPARRAARVDPAVALRQE
jgi:ABC-type antimicrobial peptide transport system permease subunit